MLEIVDAAEPPHVGDGEIRIAVRASSLPPGEIMIRSRLRREQVPPAFPHLTGHDAAGVVVKVAADADGVQVGNEVFRLARSVESGSDSDFVVLTTWAHKAPSAMRPEATAAAGTSETSTRVLDRLTVRFGQTVLVKGASGSVGALAAQLAVARRARASGIAGLSNQDRVRSLGAEATVEGDGLGDRVREREPEENPSSSRARAISTGWSRSPTSARRCAGRTCPTGTAPKPRPWLCTRARPPATVSGRGRSHRRKATARTYPRGVRPRRGPRRGVLLT
ncbi:alcohol dehydrogenase catalytic domain-containing protein [Streptomyces misionensis]|uniref:alcohol dehydrogenase catalytic domain-containing protein n=1 Tax=Streptomyces misionensis TaxID=67331 RepID=UPI0033FA6F34